MEAKTTGIRGVWIIVLATQYVLTKKGVKNNNHGIPPRLKRQYSRKTNVIIIGGGTARIAFVYHISRCLALEFFALAPPE